MVRTTEGGPAPNPASAPAGSAAGEKQQRSASGARAPVGTMPEILRLLTALLLPSPGDPTPTSKSSGWSGQQWLTYYGECRQFLLTLGEKFSSLVIQASVYTFAASGILFGLKQHFSLGFPRNLMITGPALLTLAYYWYISTMYARQAQAVGTMLSQLETTVFQLPLELSLLSTLRQRRTALFNRPWTYFGMHLYFILLGVVLTLITLGGFPLAGLSW